MIRDKYLSIEPVGNNVNVRDRLNSMETSEEINGYAQQMANVCPGWQTPKLAKTFLECGVDIDSYIALSLIEGCRVDDERNAPIVNLTTYLAEEDGLLEENLEVKKAIVNVALAKSSGYAKDIAKRFVSAGALDIETSIYILDSVFPSKVKGVVDSIPDEILFDDEDHACISKISMRVSEGDFDLVQRKLIKRAAGNTQREDLIEDLFATEQMQRGEGATPSRPAIVKFGASVGLLGAIAS